MFKKRTFFVLCLLVLFCIISLINVSGELRSIPTASVTLNKTIYNLTVGQTRNLLATVNPTDSKNKNVKWTTSNSKIAKVDASGKVIALSIGTATITITTVDGNKEDTCTVNVVSIWMNKNFVTFGDSITWYDGKEYNSASKEKGVIVKGYQSYMREQLKCVVDNQGANGNDMTQIYSIINNYNYNNINAVTITSGANDHRKGILPGTILPIGSKFKTTTYAGSIQASIEKITKTNKNIKIYLITPIRGWFNENYTYDVPNAYSGKMTISEDYVKVMKSIGKLYNISVCDLFNSPWINNLTRPILIGDKDTSPYYLHPSTKGYKRIADILIPFLS